MSSYRVTFARVVRAEWHKLTTLRSTWVVCGAVGLLTVAVSGAIGWSAGREDDAQTVAEAVGRAFLSVDLASLVIGVFGILFMTGEYGSGLIRATLAAVPRRLPVLGAKVLALVALTLPVTAVTCVAAFLASQALLPSGQRIGLDDGDVLRAIVGAAVAPVGLALMGLGVGALLRHTAAAITTYVAALLVAPTLLAAALPDRLDADVLPYSPIAAAQSLYAVDAGAAGTGLELLAPGPAALVVLAWAGGLLAGGAAVLARRDA